MRKFLHLADLHIGRKLGDYSLLPEQAQMLEQAFTVAQSCDEILIAGDVYDKPSPSMEAMTVFSDFLAKLALLEKPVSIISGNHDSAGRIAYFHEFLEKSNITVTHAFQGRLQTVKAPEEEIQIYLLPFVTPVKVRQFWQDENITTYQDAVKTILKHSEIQKDKINILVSHQFITGGVQSDEEFAVGGLDNIDYQIFDDFDYVALGHLHQAQFCGRETIRYAGSPLPYSLAEEHHQKSFTVIEVHDKQDIRISTVPVQLSRAVRTIKGSFAQLRDMNSTDYVRVIMTDEEPIPDARILLRNQFPHMLQFRIENKKLQTDGYVAAREHFMHHSETDMLCQFYKEQNQNTEPSELQMQIIQELFAKLKEENLS